MPELPEVETIRLGLQKRIIGLKITKIDILSPKSFIGIDGQPFDYTQGLRGRKVLKIWRRAKILGIDLDARGPVSSVSRSRSSASVPTFGRDQSLRYFSGSLLGATPRILTLLFHLKMSGQLILRKNSKFEIRNSNLFSGGHPTQDMLGILPNKSTRVIFEFNDGSKLFFNDQRRFGWIKIGDRMSEVGNQMFEKLGPEPLEKEFTWKVLKSNLLRHKSMSVKTAIMDQSVVSGVGNIYANEACFDAKLDPRTKVGSMSDEQFKNLYRGIKKSLQDGIKHGGSSRVHFVNSDGEKGYFLDYAYVYWRNGQKCKVCKNIVQKVQLNGRGTYFCPVCQKLMIHVLRSGPNAKRTALLP